MLWGRQGETDEAAEGPGAPPCGSSRLSQSAVSLQREGLASQCLQSRCQIPLALGVDGEGHLGCQSLASLGRGLDPEVQVLSKGLSAGCFGRGKVGSGEKVSFLLGSHAWAPRVTFSNQKHLGWAVIVVSQPPD